MCVTYVYGAELTFMDHGPWDSLPSPPHPSIQAMPNPTGSSRGSPWVDEGEAWESKALEDGEGISAAMVLGKKVEGGGPLSREEQEELSLISPSDGLTGHQL